MTRKEQEEERKNIIKMNKVISKKMKKGDGRI